MANHNINVNLRNGKGKSKTSANGSVQKISQRMSGSNPTSPKSLSNNMDKDGGMGKQISLFFGYVAKSSLGISSITVASASKIHDIFLDVNMARTGESVSVGNIKQFKKYALSPVGWWNFAKDATYGYVLDDFRIARQNTEKDYYRELSGNLIVGNQYGSKK